ncbi:CubicO group peptidase (beta-lactamase class C family) [Chitinophaga skermanii]|uniref:CubicO group peptidase (Beta-lactamase class C family) n=1 Tax=Chitinophaga skermanii TaxID=331697 RepID=A0A327QNT5_9BACT|nr:serine hydrolase domain-containing protein [Chitinophaga skermanii]RAJ05354.1 CubicO group peptidase (beta-lactamase class C family) [Chitinophaga skermanii]
MYTIPKLFPICMAATMALFSCRKSEPLPGKTHQYDFSAVDKVLNDSVPSKFGGKVYAIITVNNKVAYERGMGGYTADTKQLIASCTKWLSGAALMTLVDEGKLKLTDTVGKFLPIFTANKKGHITIGQLFSHTSGFPGNSEQGYEDNQLLTLSSAVDLIAKNVPLAAVPGTRFDYGGVGMHVAGRICEVVSGKDWNTFIKEKIYTPCGMANTDFGQTQNPIIAGGARSTPHDYTLFLLMLMNKGVSTTGNRVLSEAAVTQMELSQTANASIYYTPYPIALIGTTGIYGVGNWRDIQGSDGLLIENSSPGAFGSHPWINRSKRVTGFLFTFVANGHQATVYTSLKIRSIVRGMTF